jgi:hypothetical protein
MLLKPQSLGCCSLRTLGGQHDKRPGVPIGSASIILSARRSARGIRAILVRGRNGAERVGTSEDAFVASDSRPCSISTPSLPLQTW